MWGDATRPPPPGVQVALGVAVQQANAVGAAAAWGRIQQQAGALRRGLARVPGVALQDRGRLLCGIVSWTVVRLWRPDALIDGPILACSCTSSGAASLLSHCHTIEVIFRCRNHQAFPIVGGQSSLQWDWSESWWPWDCSRLQEGVHPEDVKAQLREGGVHVWVSPLTSTRTDMTARGLQARPPPPPPFSCFLRPAVAHRHHVLRSPEFRR